MNKLNNQDFELIGLFDDSHSKNQLKTQQDEQEDEFLLNNPKLEVLDDRILLQENSIKKIFLHLR